jgi:hypothetical protein
MAAASVPMLLRLDRGAADAPLRHPGQVVHVC